jgi:large subunit ribosomal protein L29
MPLTKAKDLRLLADEELFARVESLKEELFNLRFQFATRQLTNTSRIRQVRRDIARIRSRQTELARAVAVGARG